MPRQGPLTEARTPGQRIRVLREAKGWSQFTLARKVFATQPAVSHWENDKWLPSRATQGLLADELGTTRRFLFGDSNEPVLARAVGQ